MSTKKLSALTSQNRKSDSARVHSLKIQMIKAHLIAGIMSFSPLLFAQHHQAECLIDMKAVNGKSIEQFLVRRDTLLDACKEARLACNRKLKAKQAQGKNKQALCELTGQRDHDLIGSSPVQSDLEDSRRLPDSRRDIDQRTKRKRRLPHQYDYRVEADHLDFRNSQEQREFNQLMRVPQEIRLIEKMLTHPRLQVRLSALEDLGHYPHPYALKLAIQMKASEFSLQRTAQESINRILVVLKRTSSSMAINVVLIHLEELLNNSSIAIRHSALAVIQEFPTAKALPVVMNLIKEKQLSYSEQVLAAEIMTKIRLQADYSLMVSEYVYEIISQLEERSIKPQNWRLNAYRIIHDHGSTLSLMALIKVINEENTYSEQLRLNEYIRDLIKHNVHLKMSRIDINKLAKMYIHFHEGREQLKTEQRLLIVEILGATQGPMNSEALYLATGDSSYQVSLMAKRILQQRR